MTADRPTRAPRPPASRTLGLGLAILAVASVFIPPRARADTAATAAADLPPVRRVLLAPGEVERLPQGVLRKLTRTEFEEKLLRAAATTESQRHPPRLAEARYRARLTDGALVGTGQWKVVYAGPGPGLLPLQPLNLALRQPRFENRDAVIADFDGKTPSLLVDGPRDQTLAIEWSARAEERPEGLHFDLKFPPCPVAVLELDLPADRVAATSDGSLLSGPYPAEAPDRRLWRVGCGARPGVDLRVRRAGPAAAPTLLLARQVATQTLEPEGLDATYRIELEILHREVGELLLECDPELRPYEVSVPGLDGWELRPPVKAGAPALLVVRLREPLRYGRETLVVRCLAPLGPPATGSAEGPRPVDWRSPGVRISGAVSRGETLVILVRPELRLDGVDAGDFRLAGGIAEPTFDRRGVTRRLSFAGGGVAGPDGAPRRPGGRLRAYGVEYRARQLAWWQPAEDPRALTLQIAYEVDDGRLFRLPVLLPAAWDVERVELNPAGLLRNWGVRPAAAGEVPAGVPGGPPAWQTLAVELQRPLTAGGRAAGEPSGPAVLFGRSRVPTLTVRLVPKGPAPAAGEAVPFPDTIPLGARFREGVLAISYDPQTFQATLKASAAEGELEDDGPWGRLVPDVVYRYRGRPVEGTLALRPRPAQLRARCVSDVRLSAGRAAVNTRLILEAEAGRTDAVDLSLSAPAGGGRSDGVPRAAEPPDAWHWRVDEKGSNAVRGFERRYAAEAAEGLAALGGANPLGVSTLLSARPPGERWRLQLAHPLQPRAPLVLLAGRLLQPRSGRWEVPLPAVPDARRMDGEVTLHLAGAEFVRVETAGLQEAAHTAGRPRLGTPWRTFRYGDAAVSLVLSGRGAAVDRVAEAVADRARLTTYVGADGAARHHFSFSIANWTQRTLPLQLPSGARLVAARADGRWVTFPAAALIDEQGGLELPVPATGGAAGDHFRRFEIVYDTDAPPGASWRPWFTASGPAPVLPVPPLSFRRTWRLPPGVAPVPDSWQRRLPGSGETRESALLAVVNGSGLLSAPVTELFTRPPATGDGADGLTASLAALRPKAGHRVLRLRELVGEAADGFLDGKLVVDSSALREAGASAQSLLDLGPPDSPGEPPWAPLGLAAVDAGPAPLLTSDERARQWGAAGPPDIVREAADEALRNGHDASGTFRSASDWLRQSAEARRDDTAEPPPDLLPAPGPWTEWQPAAGRGDGSQIVVVWRGQVLAGGCLLAAVFVLGLWAARPRLAFLLAWLATCSIGWIWLPSALRPLAWLPLLACVAAALAGYLRAAVRRRAQSASPARRGAAAAAVLAALAAAGGTGTAEAPAPVTVYIVPDATGDPAREVVLAPPEFLDRLDALARSGPAAAGPVLLSESYEGKVSGRAAEFDAVFESYSLVEGAAPLSLPLDGVRLEGDVLVDGARALPQALPAPRSGVAVSLRGAGRHRIEVHFRVPVTVEDGVSGLRFGAPRAAQSRLRLRLPRGATAVLAPVKHGAQHVTAEPDGPVLEAELGHVAVPLHVIWVQDARPPEVEVREAYLWELGAEGCTLTGWLDYQVIGGCVSALAVEVPSGLELQAAEARRVGTGEPVRVRDWRVRAGGAGRVLEIGLTFPAAGKFQLGLTFVPAVPFASEVTLPLPAPRGRPADGRSHLAFRARGLSARLEATRWLTGGPVADFAPFWPEASRPDLQAGEGREAAYAATFRREGDQAPVLRLRLAPAQPRLRVTRQDLAVRVSAGQAELQAALGLAAPDGSPASVTCLLQPAGTTVSTVRGADVRRWSQDGERLTVWLDRPAAAPAPEAFALEVSAWLPAGEGGRVEIPSLRVEGAAAVPASLRLIPDAGLAITPVDVTGLRPAKASEPDVAFTAERPDYRGTCEVRAGAAGAAVRVLTVAEVRDRRLTFRSTVEYSVPRGDLRAAVVRLRNWEGEEVRLEPEGTVPVRQRERRRAADDRTWALEFRSGSKGKVRLTLTGALALADAAAGVPMPAVSVPGAASEETVLAVAGPDLAAEAPEGLSAVRDPDAALKLWPAADRQRLAVAQVWSVTGTEWALRLRPRGGAGAEPVRVLLSDHTAVVADGRHWLHEVVYWVLHGPNTDLNVLLPKPGSVVAVSVDGVDVTPLQPERRRLWVPLPGRPGVRAVRVRWRYEEPGEACERPLLQTPPLDGAVGGPAVWTVYLPGGFEAAGGDGPVLRTGPGRAAAAALFRAEAQLRVSAALAGTAREDGTAALAAAQRRFYADCRHAEQALRTANEREATDPGGVPPADQLHSLLAANLRLAKENDFEATRADAERRPDAGDLGPRVTPEEREPRSLAGAGPPRVRGPLPDWGTPAYVTLSDPGATPALTLRRVEERQARQLLAETAGWLGLLGVVALLARLPGLALRLRPFWPEPLLLLGLLAWSRSGWTVAACLLLALGAGGRVLALADGLRRLLRPRRPVPPAPRSGQVVGAAS